MSNPLSRRKFLSYGVAAFFAAPVLAMADTGALSNARERTLSFYNLHTGENLKTTYWSAGEYLPESLTAINRLLRDYRTGDIHPIHPGLLDVLCELRMRLDTTEQFELISGYRSPQTNRMLHEMSSGVASNSLHLQGMAADIRIPGRNLKVLRNTAVSMRAGGVGYYPASDFVHVDVGRVRTW